MGDTVEPFSVDLEEEINRRNGFVRALRKPDREAFDELMNTYRTETKLNRIDQLKEIIRSWGENPEELLTKDALLRGNITETSKKTRIISYQSSPNNSSN